MCHVRGETIRIERLQFVPDRHALVQLPQLRRSQQRLKIQLADEDDLKQLVLVGLQIRQDANLFEDRERQVLRLVDDQYGARLEWNQPEEKVVQCIDQLLLGDLGQPPGLHFLARDHAEVLQDPPQQILFGEERIQHERRKGRAIDLLQQRAAERGFSGTDIAGDDDKPFASADRILQQIERVAVRLAAIEVLRIRREAEWLFREPVIVFVHDYCAATPETILGVRRMISSIRLRLRTVARPSQPPVMPTFLRSLVSRSRVKPEMARVSPSTTRAIASLSATNGIVTTGLTLRVIASGAI